jgi:hypothetical protein
VPLQRLTPRVTTYTLGSLRLWQDELAEIVRLVRQLPGVEVRIESDKNLLTDVRTDLPQLGQRVSYFSVTASLPTSGDERQHEVISVKLSTIRCHIEATEPDLTTTGLIEGIRSLTASCRRMPLALLPIYQPAATNINPASATLSVGSGNSEMANRPAAEAVLGTLGGIVGTVAFILGGVFSTGVIQHLVGFHGTPFTPWVTSISVSAPLLTFGVILLFGAARSRTLLFTRTRAEAPTFWQRKRSDIIINVIVGLALYLLGLLTAHL